PTSSRQWDYNPLMSKGLPGKRDRGRPPSALALDVMVALRGRRLGNVDGVRTGERLLQPLLQGFVQPAFFGVLRAFLGAFLVRAWSRHGCPPGGSQHGCRIAA